jgi:probable F420-dependent oxidoreductase
MKIRFAVGPPAGPLSAPDLVRFATALERGGFDGIWLSDLPVAPALDPLLALALLAGRTTTLRLGANVVPFGRRPYVLAKTLAQLDQVCNGRLLLSFVTGLGQPGERAALGLDGAARGATLEDMLLAARAIWGGEPTELPAEALAAARPLQDPLEVWLGGRGPQALERVGRIADGWLGAALTPSEALPARRRIQSAAAGAGREVDPEHFGLSIGYSRGAPSAAQLESLRRRRPDIDPRELLPVGRDGLRSAVQCYIDAGLSKFVLRPLGLGDTLEGEVSWLAEAVLDLQT